MTVFQIHTVLLTAELGSISAAAKELGVSQPNASNSVKLLETEIGFAVFHRDSTGAVLTPKGEKFLEYARQILDQNEKIIALQYAEDIYRLRVGGVNYNTCFEPFLAICQKRRDDTEADLRYYNVSVEEGISKLARLELDIVIAPILKSQVAGLISRCKHEHISLSSVCEIPAVIDVRKGHPAVADGRCKNITQGSDAMKDYPYVAYRNLSEDTGSTGYNDSDFALSSYKIYVDDVDVRLRTVASTNGFMFGARSSDSLMQRYGLVAFPVSGINLEAFALTRHGDEDRREIREYMELLRQELRTVSSL